MTVSYQNEVASSTSGGFTRLLLKWRGSLYKLIYRELLLFCAAYAAVFVVYTRLLTDSQKRTFSQVRDYCNHFINLIPLSLVLGFYVTFVAQRWWWQYTAIPWPDKILHAIALYVRGTDDHSRMIRRTMVRYLNLSLVLLLRSISSAVKRRLPTLDHLVEAGFMTAAELEEFTSVPRKEFNTYWIPCCWFVSLLREARSTNHVVDCQGLKLLVETFNEFRSNCGLLWSFDWVSIPLVYTQVVTIATYSFFLACLVGRQQESGQLQQALAAKSADKLAAASFDLYIPFFTILQFLFYMGLLKVAEQLINPFGDDDEDFELNWIIDRHLKVSYLIVDTLNIRRPPLVKDMYFDDPGMILPYTEASVQYKIATYRGSVHSMRVPENQHTLVLPEIKEEQNESDEENGHIFGSTSLNSITVEGGFIDGRDPKVGAMSVPDEALLAGCARGSWSAPQNRRKRTSESTGSCGSNRRLDVTGAEVPAQADSLAVQRPQLEAQISTGTTATVSSNGDDSTSAALRSCLSSRGQDPVERRQSIAVPVRSPLRLPKRSSSYQSTHPSRWRRRKRAEVIWHPYVPPSASEQSLADNSPSTPEVACLLSRDGAVWPEVAAPATYRPARSVPSVFVQAPSVRVRGASPLHQRQAQCAAGAGKNAVVMRPSWDGRFIGGGSLSPEPDGGSGELFESARQLPGVTEAEEPPSPTPFSAAGSLPDIQHGSAGDSANSTLERKHSLPACANKRVHLVTPPALQRPSAAAAAAAAAAVAAAAATPHRQK